jgi:ABC-type lipoprotein release transport system permease subunit
MRQGVSYAAIGAVVGIAGAAATSRLLGDLLHDVGPLDPLTFIATPLLLMTIAVLASLIPGWRATRVDPVKAMNS